MRLFGWGEPSPDAQRAEQKMGRQLRRLLRKEHEVRRVRQRSDRVLKRAEVVRETLATGNWATDLLLDRSGRESGDL